MLWYFLLSRFLPPGGEGGWLLNGVVAWWAATILPASMNPLLAGHRRICTPRPRRVCTSRPRTPRPPRISTPRPLRRKNTVEKSQTNPVSASFPVKGPGCTRSVNRCQCENPLWNVSSVCYHAQLKVAIQLYLQEKGRVSSKGRSDPPNQMNFREKKPRPNTSIAWLWPHNKESIWADHPHQHQDHQDHNVKYRWSLFSTAHVILDWPFALLYSWPISSDQSHLVARCSGSCCCSCSWLHLLPDQGSNRTKSTSG